MDSKLQQVEDPPSEICSVVSALPVGFSFVVAEFFISFLRVGLLVGEVRRESFEEERGATSFLGVV